MRVQRGQQAGAGGLPGQGGADDSGGDRGRGRTAPAGRLLHRRLQAQVGVLFEKEPGDAEAGDHEAEPDLRGHGSQSV